MIDARNQITNPHGRGGAFAPIGVAVHHSVTTARESFTEQDERAHISRIDDIHVQQGFGGFGYHGCSFPSGRSYWCGDGQRAHVKGRNHELWGWCLIGDFSQHLPVLTSPPMQAARQAILELAGSLPIKGHGDWALPGEGTACPGLLAAVDWRSPIWTQPPAPTPDPPALEDLADLRTLRYVLGAVHRRELYFVPVEDSGDLTFELRTARNTPRPETRTRIKK